MTFRDYVIPVWNRAGFDKWIPPKNETMPGCCSNELWIATLGDERLSISVVRTGDVSALHVILSPAGLKRSDQLPDINQSGRPEPMTKMNAEELSYGNEIFLAQIDEELLKLGRARAALAGMIEERPPDVSRKKASQRRKRKMSPASRARIAEAQKKRWAGLKKSSSTVSLKVDV